MVSDKNSYLLKTDEPNKLFEELEEIVEREINIVEGGINFIDFSDNVRTRFKQFLKLKGFIEGVAILNMTEYGKKSRLSIFSFSGGSINHLETVKSSSFNFLRDYSRLVYDYKIDCDPVREDLSFEYYCLRGEELEPFKNDSSIMDLMIENRNVDFDTEAYYDINIFTDYSNGKFDKGEKSKNFKRDNLYKILDYLSKKGFWNDSGENFNIYVSYNGVEHEESRDKFMSVPENVIESNLTTGRFLTYIQDLINPRESFNSGQTGGEISRRTQVIDYNSNEIFFESIVNNLNCLPSPEIIKSEETCSKIVLNKKELGEIEVLLIIEGELKFKSISDNFKFKAVFQHNWLSEQPEEEFRHLRKISQ